MRIGARLISRAIKIKSFREKLRKMIHLVFQFLGHLQQYFLSRTKPTLPAAKHIRSEFSPSSSYSLLSASVLVFCAMLVDAKYIKPPVYAHSPI